MSKRGQVSLFIIIGVLMIAAMSVVFYVQSEKTTEEIQVDRQEFSNDEQNRLYSYVSGCLKDASADAMQIMSLQGGFIDIPSDVEVNTVKNQHGLTVYEENGIKRIKKGNGLNAVPFWVTKNSINIPSKELMQEQAAEYIKKRVAECTGDFSSFKQEGFSVDKGELSSDVDMGSSVVMSVNYPVTLEKQDKAYNVEDYKLTLPINIDKILDVSEQLSLYEINNAYLEHHTTKLIDLFSGLDENKLPPTFASRVNLGCDYVTWSTSSVKARLKSILNDNIPALKIAGTKFNRIEASGSGVYDGMIMDILDRGYENMMIDLQYKPEFDLNLKVLPSNGDMIRPSTYSKSGLPIASMLCVHTYRFKYYVDYPVLFNVKDESSAGIVENKIVDNAGYRFDYLMNTYVVGNQPRKFVPLKSENAPLNVEDVRQAAGGSVDFIDNSKFCEDSNKKSEEMTFEVVDDEYNSLDNAQVYYACGAAENNCYVGKTEDGILKSKLPLCRNGLLTFQKRDYGTVHEKLTTIDKESTKEQYIMTPFESYDYSLKIIDVKDLINDYLKNDRIEPKNAAQDLDDDEFASIQLENTPNTVISAPSDDKIKIAKGSFPLSIQVFGDVGVDSSQIDNFDKNISNFPLGSFDYNWQVLGSELSEGSKIQFYSMVNFNANEISELNDLTGTGIIDSKGNIKAEVIRDSAGNIASIVPVNNVNYEVPEGGSTEQVEIAASEYEHKLRPEVE